MATLFDLFGIKILFLVIGISKKIKPQSHIYTYFLSELIYHSIIFVFKIYIGNFLIIFFFIF